MRTFEMKIKVISDEILDVFPTDLHAKQAGVYARPLQHAKKSPCNKDVINYLLLFILFDCTIRNV